MRRLSSPEDCCISAHDKVQCSVLTDILSADLDATSSLTKEEGPAALH
jgi:hypothetical protein